MTAPPCRCPGVAWAGAELNLAPQRYSHELARRAAQGFDAFYAQRRVETAPAKCEAVDKCARYLLRYKAYLLRLDATLNVRDLQLGGPQALG